VPARLRGSLGMGDDRRQWGGGHAGGESDVRPLACRLSRRASSSVCPLFAQRVLLAIRQTPPAVMLLSVMRRGRRPPQSPLIVLASVASREGRLRGRTTERKARLSSGRLSVLWVGVRELDGSGDGIHLCTVSAHPWVRDVVVLLRVSTGLREGNRPTSLVGGEGLTVKGGWAREVEIEINETTSLISISNSALIKRH
jgi:hypothetical protein